MRTRLGPPNPGLKSKRVGGDPQMRSRPGVCSLKGGDGMGSGNPEGGG